MSEDFVISLSALFEFVISLFIPYWIWNDIFVIAFHLPSLKLIEIFIIKIFIRSIII